MNRPAGPVPPRNFGKRPPFTGAATSLPQPVISAELRLFALTYAVGFVSVSLFIA